MTLLLRKHTRKIQPCAVKTLPEHMAEWTISTDTGHIIGMCCTEHLGRVVEKVKVFVQ